jgi:hypothetical protein
MSFWDDLYLGETGIKPLDWCSNKFHDIHISLIVAQETIERFFYWGWKLRKSHDFDFAFLEEMMLLKLKRMEKCFKKHGNTVWCQVPDAPEYKHMRALELAIRLLERLDKDEYRSYETEGRDIKILYSILTKYGRSWWD